jgi:hypothetical protein
VAAPRATDHSGQTAIGRVAREGSR